ncbi:MAG: hypothetical protein FWB90_00665 [Fibromonadales bacterium]|nr:hypothetical protein [Fibromonadales bacterium]
MSIEVVLKERSALYGSYEMNAEAKEAIAGILQALPSWGRAEPVHRQGAMMVIDKLVRAFNGDPRYPDNWVDIQGYAKLVEGYIAKEAANADA